MMTQKLIPVKLPIDPAKAHLYVARNELGVRSITPNHTGEYLCIQYLNNLSIRATNKGEATEEGIDGYDITHEIVEEETITKFAEEWNTLVNNFTGGKLTSNQFQESAVRILKISEGSQPATDINQSLTGKNEEMSQPVTDDRNYQGCMADLGDLLENVIGNITGKLSGEELKGYVQRAYPQEWEKYNKPKEHTIELWVNINKLPQSGGDIGCGGVHTSRKAADQYGGEYRIACLHFTRTFTEGEGL